MLETTRYEARQRVRGTLALTVLLGAFALLIIYIFPTIAESSADIDALIESLPESFREGFGAETYTTIEGFVAAELYQTVWVLLLGLYVAYAAAGTLADDVESGRLYLVLAAPISRKRVAFEKFLSLGVPIVTLNLAMPLVVFGGTIAIDYPLDPYYLLVVHALSVPYLLVCGGIGLLLSVVLNRGDTAQRAGIALVFLLFLVDSVTLGTDFEWLGAISPTRYIDPTEVLLHETVDLADSLLLLVVATLLVVVSLLHFQRRDL
ncbi:ABC transporter permease [Haloplanus litoreus]|uniref:ABC transporter permease n=1 Tax=Haloplanus litoreus TaxID=767515 RepID=A0ABD5ZU37_9EURY